VLKTSLQGGIAGNLWLALSSSFERPRCRRRRRRKEEEEQPEGEE
jgi:hypothetical protein